MTKKQKQQAVRQLRSQARYWEKKTGRHSFLHTWFEWAANHLIADKAK